MIDGLLDIKNNIDFFLRNKFAFSRKNFAYPNEQKEGMFSTREEKIREAELFKKYSLLKMKNYATRDIYLENLDILDILDRYFNFEPKNNLNILDIGSKSWNYAKGEYYFFKSKAKTLYLTGVELDANRLYTNLYSRKQIAKANIKGLKNVKYLSDNLLNHKNKYDIITWFLPFIFENPHKKWGLPLKYFKPEKMLLHAVSLLTPEGKMFIVNQGEVEYLEQIKLCEKLNLKFQKTGKISPSFNFYPKERYLIIIEN